MNDLSAERSLRNGPHETVHGSSDGPTMAPRSFPSADEQDLDLAKLFGLLWRRKWVILLSSLVFASLAAYWAYSQTPFFTASTSVYYSQSRNQVVDIESVVTSGPVTTTFLTSELKIIRSQQLLNRVVEEYGLDQDPEFNYALRPPQTSMIGSVIGWARETASSIISPSDALKTIRGQQDLPPDLPGAEGQEIGTLSRERLRIISTFQRAVTVRIEDRSFVIRISVKTQNPTKSARLANAVARHYIVDQLEAKYQATARASDWLSERVVDLRERVETAETKVEHFRSETGIASEDASSELVLEVSALESRLEAAQGDLDRAQGDLATLRRVMDEGDFASALPLINRPSAVDTLRAFQAAAET
ncbi:MAG: GumC family protein, partial [Pseudomonadota bacterium]